MQDKNSLDKKSQNIIKEQFFERFNIDTLVAKDFVAEYIKVDMYCNLDKFGIICRYGTVGLCAEYFDDYAEIFFMSNGRLGAEKEKIMLQDISNIICKIHNKDVEIVSGATVKVSDEAKKNFGFDYYFFDIYDFDFTYLNKPIYIIMPVQIYENEYNYLQANGLDAFLKEYQKQVPKEDQLAFGLSRKQMNV